LWVVDGIPLNVEKDADDHVSLAAIGVASDGSWIPLEALHFLKARTKYRVGSLPRSRSAVPRDLIRQVFVRHL
jgi:hypothetical protein